MDGREPLSQHPRDGLRLLHKGQARLGHEHYRNVLHSGSSFREADASRRSSTTKAAAVPPRGSAKDAPSGRAPASAPPPGLKRKNTARRFHPAALGLAQCELPQSPVPSALPKASFAANWPPPSAGACPGPPAKRAPQGRIPFPESPALDASRNARLATMSTPMPMIIRRSPSFPFHTAL